METEFHIGEVAREKVPDKVDLLKLLIIYAVERVYYVFKLVFVPLINRPFVGVALLEGQWLPVFFPFSSSIRCSLECIRILNVSNTWWKYDTSCQADCKVELCARQVEARAVLWIRQVDHFFMRTNLWPIH